MNEAQQKRYQMLQQVMHYWQTDGQAMQTATQPLQAAVQELQLNMHSLQTAIERSQLNITTHTRAKQQARAALEEQMNRMLPALRAIAVSQKNTELRWMSHMPPSQVHALQEARLLLLSKQVANAAARHAENLLAMGAPKTLMEEYAAAVQGYDESLESCASSRLARKLRFAEVETLLRQLHTLLTTRMDVYVGGLVAQYPQQVAAYKAARRAQV